MRVLTDELDNYLSSRLRSQFGFSTLGMTAGMIAVIVGALLLAAIMALYEMYRSAKAAARAEAAAKEAAAARGRMSVPPTHDWQLMEGHTYCTFLSHYKVRPHLGQK